jgi:hypothetical protein
VLLVSFIGFGFSPKTENEKPETVLFSPSGYPPLPLGREGWAEGVTFLDPGAASACRSDSSISKATKIIYFN